MKRFFLFFCIPDLCSDDHISACIGADASAHATQDYLYSRRTFV